MDEALVEKVRHLALPLLDAAELGLVEVQVHPGPETVVRLLIDRPTGGVTLAECAEINERMAHKLDLTDWLKGPYLLEVCSPGLDRPFKTREEFRRHVGRRVQIHFTRPLDGKQGTEGELVGLNDEAVLIRTRLATLPILYDQIDYATVEIEP